MKTKYFYAVHGSIAAILFILPLLLLQAQENSDSDLLSSVNVPFDMPVMQAPVFPDRTFDIRDYGAIGDGKTLNTHAFDSAITACADAGGGKVLIPKGIWFTGPIHLKSNVNLHIAQGAEVRFSNNPDDYLPVVFTRLEGIECYNYSPLIYAIDCNNIAITGKGVFNGQGEPWWPWKKKQKKAVQELYDSQFNGIPVNRRIYGTPEAALRPPMIQLLNCKNVLLEDFTSKNSPFWTIHLVYCDFVVVRNIVLLNPENAPNTDGLNLDSSTNVYIQGLFADVGDDAICIKSGMNEDGWRVGRPSENIVVENCHVKKGHGGIVFGSDMSGGIRNVFVQNCEYDGTLMGIRMKSMRGRGGYIEKVWIQDIKMNNIGWHAIILNMFYGASSATSRSDTPPQFHDIHIKNITCHGAQDAVTLRGLPEKNIENITLENITITADNGLTASDASAIELTNVNITPHQGAVMSLQDCRNVTIKESGAPIDCDTFLHLKGKKTGRIRLIDNDLLNVHHEVIIEKEVPAGAVNVSDTMTLEQKVMDGEYWRDQVLTDLMPYWYKHVRDIEHGAFHLNLSRDWQPMPPWDKMPAMISRQIFSFSTAYLLSGEEKYLDVAREAVDYLLKYGWDQEYGGWFESISQTGEPKITEKRASSQIYNNVGLTQYYFVTGDERVLSYIRKSVKIHKTYSHDEEFDGYYTKLNRDLSVSDSSKAKHSHYGQGSLMPYLIMATRDSAVISFSKRLADISIERMYDPVNSWILGYPNGLDREWGYVPYLVDGKESIYLGACSTAALFFLHLYHLTGEESYLNHGKALGDQLSQYGWDKEQGYWFFAVEKAPPYHPAGQQKVYWWIQIYGAFLQLQLYHVTQDEQYLENFKKTEFFYDRYFRDREYGGVFLGVAPNGSFLGKGEKAKSWHTSFHEIEHGFLNYLNLNLYVNKKPVVLHFKLDGPKKHFVSPLADPKVQITGVRINGNPWTNFDACERSITLPAGKNMNVEVILEPISDCNNE